MLFAVASSAFAGGILTNTNQSVAFLKNPARDAAIGLDGVYSNPAGDKQHGIRANGACSSTSLYLAAAACASLKTDSVLLRVLWQ